MLSILFFLYNHIGNVISALIVASGAIFTVTSVTRKFFMYKNKFDTHNNRNLTNAVYDLIQQQMWFCNGYVIWKNKQCPTGLVVGKNFRFMAYIESNRYDGRENIYISLYSLRGVKCIVQDLIDNAETLDTGDIFCTDAAATKMNLVSKCGEQHIDEWDTHEVIAYRSIEHVPQQSQEVSDAVLQTIKEQKYIGGVFLFSGAPGKGKTLACKLTALKLGAAICMDYNPSKPGQSLRCIIRGAPPSAANPLVIVIEEVDKIFDKLGHITEHERLITQVTNKDDWNNMLDYVHCLENVVLICTSNMSLKELATKYDPALTRDYRITKRFTFGATQSAKSSFSFV